MSARPALAARRKARGLTQEELAEYLGVDRSTIVRWERGTSTPRPWARHVLAERLGTDLEGLDRLLTGTFACTPALSDEPAEPSMADPVDFVRRTRLDNPIPAHVDRSDVEEVRMATRVFAASENMYGGGLSLAGAAGQLRWAARMLRSRAPGNVRSALLEAVGNLAGVVGFSAFDIADYSAAERYFRFALWCAEQADSWALRAAVLTDLARLAAHLGELRRALAHTEQAQVHADRLPATSRAVVSTVQARLLALHGEHDKARANVDCADAWFADRDPDSDPPWLVYYDKAEHAGSIGRALITIANATSRPELAAPRLRTAIESQNADYPRSQAFSQIRLATLTMRHGDPHEAVDLGIRAVTGARSLRSQRVLDELHGLAQASKRHAHIHEVDELRDAITSLTAAA